MEKQFCPLKFGDYELDVRIDVGPRIMTLRRPGEPNVFYENPKHVNLHAGGADYRSYGGHRLLRSPELDRYTYVPDNEAVEVISEGSKSQFRTPTDTWSLQKELSVWFENNRIHVGHRIYNHGIEPVRCASWGISVMIPGGAVWVPRSAPPATEFAKLPTQPFVLWPYTNLSDARFHYGEAAIGMSHADVPRPTKFGMLVNPGVAVYSHPQFTFVKRFPCEQFSEYPDFQCNFEAYTRHDMLEVESLGPLVNIEPGSFTEHIESWELLPPMSIKNPESAAAYLSSLSD